MNSWKMDVVGSNNQRMRWNDNQAIFSSVQPGSAGPVHHLTFFSYRNILAYSGCCN